MGGSSGAAAAAVPGAWFPSEEDAVRAAREEVKNMFRSASELSRLPAFLHECARKRAGIDAQLSSAVRTQVDETRLGLQLLQDATTMMTAMRRNFLAIDQYCRDCKLVLRDSPEIQRVNTARKNLDATTRLLDKFRSLPAQAEALLDELDASDRAIKGVYKRMRLLFRLRDSALDQNTGSGPSLPGSGGGFSADFLEQLQENFEELHRSAAAVEERVWENIADATLLAKDDPVTLVRTLEVIEMEDRAMRKVFGTRPTLPTKTTGSKAKTVKDKEKEKASQKALMPLESGSSSSMRDKCLTVLEKSVADQFNHLHIDEEQAMAAEKAREKEQRKKQQALEEAKAKLRREEAERKKAAKAARIAAGEEEEDEDEEEEDAQDVDEPEEINSPPLGRKGGLYHDDDEDEDDEDELAAGAKKKKDQAAPSDYILSILEELTDLVESLPSLLNSIVPVFPPDYELPRFYIERYCRWLKLTLNFHCNDPSRLSKKAQLRAVNWLEWYRTELRKWETTWPGTTPLRTTARQALQAFEANGGGSDPTGKKARVEAARAEAADASVIDELVRELMRSYTASTTDTLMRLCDNILASEERAEAEQDAEGLYRTSAPADLFYTMNSTLEIVLSSFGTAPLPLASVCLMVADIFTYYQNAQLSFLQFVELEGDDLFFGPKRIRKEDTYFCAVINNSSQSQEHMDDLKDKILDRLRSVDNIEQQPPLPTNPSNNQNNNSSMQPKNLLDQLEDTFEECGEGFVSVASEATDLLVLQISVTLQKPCANLFSPSWLKDSSVTDDIVLTLADFAGDYKKWIGRDAYFSRIMTKVLHSVIAEYLRKLTDVKPAVSDLLFERLKLDKQILQEFFMQYAWDDSEEGIAVGASASQGAIPASLVKSELRLLTLVNKVVHADPDFMAVHFERLIARFGLQAKEVMEGLLAMRTDLKKEQRRELMEKFLAKLPAPDQAQLLERQLVAQNVAALASPKSAGGAGGGVGGKAGGSGAGKSFWDVFKSREKKAEKAKPSAALAPSKRINEDGTSMSEFLA